MSIAFNNNAMNLIIICSEIIVNMGKNYINIFRNTCGTRWLSISNMQHTCTLCKPVQIHIRPQSRLDWSTAEKSPACRVCIKSRCFLMAQVTSHFNAYDILPCRLLLKHFHGEFTCIPCLHRRNESDVVEFIQALLVVEATNKKKYRKIHTKLKHICREALQMVLLR